MEVGLDRLQVESEYFAAGRLDRLAHPLIVTTESAVNLVQHAGSQMGGRVSGIELLSQGIGPRRHRLGLERLERKRRRHFGTDDANEVFFQWQHVDQLESSRAQPDDEVSANPESPDSNRLVGIVAAQPEPNRVVLPGDAV